MLMALTFTYHIAHATSSEYVEYLAQNIGQSHEGKDPSTSETPMVSFFLALGRSVKLLTF